jgi:hypothetical protein
MMNWHDFYYSDLQSVWALLVAPFAFLVYRAVQTSVAECAETRFLIRYTVVWAVLTMLDPVATGPLSRALGISNTELGTAVMFLFVLLGDLRVFVLIFGTAAQSASGTGAWHQRALAFSFIVPIATGILYGSLKLLNPEIPGQVMWLIYEAGFLGMTVWLARREIPAAVGPNRPELRAMLTSCAGYAAAYYALWAACDIAILAGVDEAWAVRSIPNQLYYALWIPFVYVRSAPLRALASPASSR